MEEKITVNIQNILHEMFKPEYPIEEFSSLSAKVKHYHIVKTLLSLGFDMEKEIPMLFCLTIGRYEQFLCDNKRVDFNKLCNENDAEVLEGKPLIMFQSMIDENKQVRAVLSKYIEYDISVLNPEILAHLVLCIAGNRA